MVCVSDFSGLACTRLAGHGKDAYRSKLLSVRSRERLHELLTDLVPTETGAHWCYYPRTRSSVRVFETVCVSNTPWPLHPILFERTRVRQIGFGGSTGNRVRDARRYPEPWSAPSVPGIQCCEPEGSQHTKRHQRREPHTDAFDGEICSWMRSSKLRTKKN